MYRIENAGDRRARRLVSDVAITPAEFDAIARQLDEAPMVARKLAPVAARRSPVGQEVVTRFNGQETRNKAAVGDWIVTLLDTRGVALKDGEGNVNQYVIRKDRFESLYEPLPDPSSAPSDYGEVFKPRNAEPVEALAFPGGFDIVAPWGERQSGSAGYILRNGADIYGNQQATFDATYVVEP